MNKTIIVGLIIGAIALVATQGMTNVVFAATAGCTGPFAFVCAIALPGFASGCAGTLCATVGTAPR
jgi:hypothetical protein